MECAPATLPSTAASTPDLGANVSVELTQVGRDVHVSVVPPAGARVPSDVICVVDVSGSMQSDADLPGEAVGLTTLDVVRHALRTVVSTLGVEDRVAVVPFSTGAQVALPLTPTTEAGKEQATSVLETLRPSGCTNMWEGIKRALDLAAHRDGARPASVLLLTDGVPSDGGHAAKLQGYLRDREVAPAVLSTFGFGYSLNSKLLEELAVCGGGTYSFIPDAGLVGTVFVHAVANLLCRMSPVCQLHLEHSASFSGPAWAGQREIELDLGMVQYGQARNLVVTLDADGDASLRVGCVLRVGAAPVVARGEWVPATPARAAKLRDTQARQRLLALVAEARELAAAGQHEAAVERVAAGAAALEALETDALDFVKDAEGQVREAVCKPEWFAKWGQHYLPSLQLAHGLEQCNNFKDPGVQHYGGAVFADLRDLADELFLQLPPPAPSRRAQLPAAQRATCRPVDMSAYLNASGGCFAAGLVATAGGAKPVSEVRAGDVLASGAVVQCVVETRFDAPVEVVDLGTCVVTPWHPVRSGDAWVFPAALAQPQLRRVAAVYALLLEAGAGSFAIGGWDAVALGHGIDAGAAAHEFFGSRAAVCGALGQCRGLAAGHIVFRQGWLLRDEEGRACGARADHEVAAAAPPARPAAVLAAPIAA